MRHLVDINAGKNKIFSAKNSLFLSDLSSKWWRIYASVRKRICATTCFLNSPEKDCFLAKMSEISGFDAIIFRIFNYVAF